MPSKENWKEYFALVGDLRHHAIWRWRDDGKLTQSGRDRPPRFVAVVEPEQWGAIARRVEGIGEAQQRTKWPVQLYPEVWGWGKVSVTSAASSRRLPVGKWYSLGVSEKATKERAESVVARLVAEGHKARVKRAEGGFELEVYAKRAGLSARWGYGDAYTLRAWDVDGNLKHRKLSVGVVVVQGVQQGIFLDETPRKKRRDAALQVCGWAGVDLYQVDSAALLTR